MGHTRGMATKQELDDRVAGQNIPQLFLKTLADHADVEVLRWKDSSGAWQTWTLTQLSDAIARLVTSLRDLGIGHGDRVVMMLTNRPEFHALDIAILFAGATPVSIYNSSAPDQIDYLVNHCGAKMAIIEEDFLPRFEEVRGKLLTLEHMAVLSDGAVGEGILSYADLAAAEPADLVEAAKVAQPEDLATIIYTSGTTGPPKGVMLSHYNVCWTLASISQSMRDQTDITDFAGMSHLSYLPMAHIFERLIGHYYLVDLATQVVCCPNTAELADYVREVKPNLFIGVPRVWEKFYAGVNAALAADPEKAKSFNEAVVAAEPIVAKMAAGTATKEEIETYEFLDAVAFSKVRPLIGLDECKIGITGAAPIPPEILTWFRTIGVPLSEGYGLSETTAILSWAHAARAGYVGKAASGVELTIAEDGEVLAVGGCIFGGYLDAPDKTDEALDSDGYFHTGDIGVIDDDGYLKIVDRKKELIITAGGKNISPANLESAMKMIPLVGQVCAVGEARPFVAALVVLDPDASAAWAAKNGLEGEAASTKAMAENPVVIAEIEGGLAGAMSKFNNAEAIKKVKVLADEWMPDTDLLTPTSKLKRRGILSAFDAEIQALYEK